MLPGFPVPQLNTAVPSFLPAMGGISGAIDHFAQRRMQLRQEEERRAQQALDAKIAADKDAYYRGKVAAEERKQTSRENFQRAQMGQSAIESARKEIAAGRSPGTMLLQDKSGNPVVVKWTYTGKRGPRPLPAPPAQPAPTPESEPPPMAAEAPPPAVERAVRSSISPPQLTRPTLTGGPIAAPRPAPQGGIPTMMGRPLMPPPVSMAQTGPAQPPQPEVDPFENMRSNSVFVDENAEGDVRALTGPEDEQTMNLPEDAFPPGAREGMRFAAQDVNMRGGKGNPFASPISTGRPAPEEMFVDETSDGQATVLPEGGGQEWRPIELPMEALPPGAREGQRFAGGDVNLRGGKGNPYAEPAPPEPLPQVERQPMPEMLDLTKEADVTAVSPTQARGALYESEPNEEEEDEGLWQATLPDGQVITIDPAEAKRAQLDAARREALGIDAVIQSQPNISPEQKSALMLRRNLIISGLPLKMIHQLGQQQGTMDRERLRGENTMAVKEKEIASREKIASEANQIRLTIAQMKKKKGGAGSLLGGRAGYNGGAFEAYNAKDPYKAMRLAYYLNSEVQGSLRNFNWQKLEAGGVNRLPLALKTIEEGGAGEFEAVMNFFGYVRNGVPAKNETDLWHEMTGTTTTLLNKWGMKLKMGALGDLISRRDLTPEERQELKTKYTGLTPDRKVELKRAIKASLDAVQSYAAKAAEALAQHYRGRPQIHQEIIQGKIDELRYFARLPERTYFNMPGWSRGIDVTEGAAGGGGRGEEGGGKMTDAQLLEALRGMK